MAIIVNYKNIETDNLIMSLDIGCNYDYFYDLYARYNLAIEKDINKLVKYINKSDKFDRSMLNKLFLRFAIKGNETSLFHFVFNWRAVSFGKSFDEFIFYIENIDEKTIIKYIYSKLLKLYLNKEECELTNEEIKIEKILELLVKLDGDIELKWNITEVCLDIKGFFYKCSEFFKKCIRILESRLIIFNDRGKIWGEKLEKRIEKEGLSLLKPLLDDFNENNYKNIYVSPRIMDNYAFDWGVMFSSNEIYFYIGENFEILNDIFGAQNERKWIQNIFKYLSDTSRFEIIKSLKEKPSYGTELAEKFSLSTATISYHINILFFVKLIEEIKIEGKSYIKVKNRSIEKFIEVFRNEFGLLEDNFNIDRNAMVVSNDDEEILFNVIKCISDTSRYEILRCLTEKNMYGGEIAKAMGLSGGAISYHAKVLLSNNLISEKRVNSRIYYDCNKKMLIKWLTILKKLFKINN